MSKQLIVSTPEQTLIDIFKYSKYTDPYSKKAQLGRKIIKLVNISKLEGLITATYMSISCESTDVFFRRKRL